MAADCPCGSGVSYEACCGPLHSGAEVAVTAEALMRSRYSAFAVGDAEYLLASWHPSRRPTSLDMDPATHWRRLAIRDTRGGGADDETGTVHFVAHFWDATHREYGRLEEDSRFLREDGRWFYVEAVT